MTHGFELEGLACDWGAADARTGRLRYLKCAFAAAVRSTTLVDILVDHRGHRRIGRALVSWRADEAGLHFKASVLSRNSFVGCGAWLALRHGWFQHVSLGCSRIGSRDSIDDRGRLEVISAAKPVEISLTNSPAYGASWVKLVDYPRATRRELPGMVSGDQMTREADHLIRWLRCVGIDNFEPDPMPKATLPAIKPTPFAMPERPALFSAAAHQPWRI